MIGDCWEIGGWDDRIKPIKVISETSKMVTFERDGVSRPYQMRRMKSSVSIFATWEEAKAYKVELAEKELKYAKQRVDLKRSELELAKALKKDNS